MALTTCKRCNRIFSSDAESCPYCGEANPGNTPIDPGSKQQRIRNIGIGFLVLALLAGVLVQYSVKNDESEANAPVDSGSPIKSTCLSADCPGGTKAVTNTMQQEPFYSCKSNELSEYANYVLSVMLKQVEFAGVPPEVSRKTGEPAVQGNDKILLDKYRAQAGVSSFEEAISKCYRGKEDVNVVVLYNPKDSNSIYVAAEEDPKNRFWLPKARLDKE